LLNRSAYQFIETQPPKTIITFGLSSRLRG
jgi:hypothetical protein